MEKEFLLAYLDKHLEAFAILLGFIFSVITFVLTSAHERKIRKQSNDDDHDFQLRRNYQALEFEAARIFQVCVDSPEIPLYLDNEISEAEGGRHIAERCYWFVCQTLNIFEVFISYRRNDMVPPDVFATWVSWFHELGTASRFKDFWVGDELWSHYKPDVQMIMNAALKIVDNRSPNFEKNENWYDEELGVFHREVSHIFDDDASIRTHFEESLKRRRALRLIEGVN